MPQSRCEPAVCARPGDAGAAATRRRGPGGVGSPPRRAGAPPGGLSPTALAAVLRTMRVPIGIAQLHRLAGGHGLGDTAALDELLTALVAAGVVREQAAQRPRAVDPGARLRAAVRPARRGAAVFRGPDRAHQPRQRRADGLGRGPGGAVGLPGRRPAAGARPGRPPGATCRCGSATGRGLVGPLVIPGVTSCPGLRRPAPHDRDAAWPVAAQLRDVIGSADRPTVLATARWRWASYRIITAVRGVEGASAPPATLDTTLEIDVNSNRIMTRRWSRHRAASADSGGCQYRGVGDDGEVADDIKRGRAARNAKLASIPVGFAGRAALGFGKRLTGKSRDEVNAELMEKAANQLFTVLGELKGGAMKVGQALSVMETRDPEEFRRAPPRGADQAAEGRPAAVDGQGAPGARRTTGHRGGPGPAPSTTPRWRRPASARCTGGGRTAARWLRQDPVPRRRRARAQT